MDNMNTYSNQSLYGIIGYPLFHSNSSFLFDWVFREMNINSTYMAWEILPQNLPEFMHVVRNMHVQGLSITIPHKENILQMVDIVSDSVKKIGAANTICWKDNLLCAENTDFYGFISPIQHKRFEKALVLGAGGGARAVLAGLKELKIQQIAICNHNMDRAKKLASEFEVEFIAWEEREQYHADLIINATPLGTIGEWQGLSPYEKKAFKGTGLAYDLVYNPPKTPFLSYAQSAGWEIQNGLDMFVAQANMQLKLWTGKEFNAVDAKQLLSQKLELEFKQFLSKKAKP